jgi:hypothetical protein
LRVVAREAADRIERFPHGDHEELDALLHIPSQERCVVEARELHQLREGLRVQVLDVGVSEFTLRNAAPMSRDHPGGRELISGMPRAYAADATGI